MFKLYRPCANCPFKKGQGSAFRLRLDRLIQIFNGPAFQCHKTVDYNGNEEDEDGLIKPMPGDKPQQCAGLMAILHREGRPNQIMQVSSRLGYMNLTHLDPDNEAYASMRDAIRAHRDGYEPRPRKK